MSFILFYIARNKKKERQNLLEVYLSNLVGDDVAKLNALMQQAVRPLAKFIHKAFQKTQRSTVCFIECSTDYIDYEFLCVLFIIAM